MFIFIWQNRLFFNMKNVHHIKADKFKIIKQLLPSSQLFFAMRKKK